MSAGLLTAAGVGANQSSRVTTKADASGYVGNEACAKCHASIFESYERTAMAHASGPATENPIAGDFLHKKSGVHYRIYSEDGKLWLSFERPGDPSLRGKRELLYYIGQGRRGRTYLFSVDGFLFESPVNWYADKHMWDMAPAYGNVREAPMNLPALTSCLDCHVSGIQPPIQGTENRYKMPVFAYSGVACERCHGPGAAHVNGGAIVNPFETFTPNGATPSACSVTWRAMLRLSGRASTCISFVLATISPTTFGTTSRERGAGLGLAGGEPVRGAGAKHVQEEVGRGDVVHQLPRSASLRAGRGAGFVLSREVPGLPRRS